MSLPLSTPLRFAASCAALLIALSPPAPASEPPLAPLIDDDALVEHVETVGAALIRDGKCVKLKTLRAQLSRARTCALDLPISEQPLLAPSEMYARRAPGVLIVGVLARLKKRAKYDMAGCTGFALTTDVFVTNYHVIDNPEGEAIVVMTHDGQVNGSLEVLAADKLTDVAILRATGASFTPLPLALDSAPVGSPVWTLSHPDHNFFSLTAGMVSRYFVATTEWGRTPQMAITADFGAGSSGGPILDARGQVSGMVCSTTSVYWEDKKGKVNDLQMVFKHCIPIRSIRQLIVPGASSAAAAQLSSSSSPTSSASSARPTRSPPSP